MHIKQQIVELINAEEQAQLMKILFFNFTHHPFTIDVVRDYLGSLACQLAVFEQLAMLGAYSDHDLPQKRQMLEHFIRTRAGHDDRSIELYTQSYGLTESTLAFVGQCLKDYKEGHRTLLLNIFLCNVPTTAQTEAMRLMYRHQLF